MKEYNPYNLYDSPQGKKPRAFNTDSGSFQDTCHEVEPEQRNAALDAVDALIRHTYKTLFSEKD